MKYKKTALTLTAAVGAALASLAVLFGAAAIMDKVMDNRTAANRLDGIYPKSGTVIAVNLAEDTVTFTDQRGDVWSFYGAEDWMEGDRIAVIMDDNGTPGISDDLVLAARYEGYTG